MVQHIDGISASFTSKNIADFFVFSSPTTIYYTASGTTPVNRFEFNLASLDHAACFPAPEQLLTSRQPERLLLPPPPSNYSFTMTALGVAPVPEPATSSIFGVGLLGSWFIRRRRVH